MRIILYLNGLTDKERNVIKNQLNSFKINLSDFKILLYKYKNIFTKEEMFDADTSIMNYNFDKFINMLEYKYCYIPNRSSNIKFCLRNKEFFVYENEGLISFFNISSNNFSFGDLTYNLSNNILSYKMGSNNNTHILDNLTLNYNLIKKVITVYTGFNSILVFEYQVLNDKMKIYRLKENNHEHFTVKDKWISNKERGIIKSFFFKKKNYISCKNFKVEFSNKIIKIFYKKKLFQELNIEDKNNWKSKIYDKKHTLEVLLNKSEIKWNYNYKDVLIFKQKINLEDNYTIKLLDNENNTILDTDYYNSITVKKKI